jgi:uncharacterized RDD family membrane protein YckC
MPRAASFAAAPRKRLWAWCFDMLSVLMLLWLTLTVAGGIHVDLDGRTTLAMLFFAYHFIALALREGRTLGKAAVEIMVVAASAGRLSPLDSAARAGYRTLPLLIAAAPMGEPDVTAGITLLVLTAIELHLLERSPTRQTVADLLARSVVVDSPPRAPYRVPARTTRAAPQAAPRVPSARQPTPEHGEWHKRSPSKGAAACRPVTD